VADTATASTAAAGIRGAGAHGSGADTKNSVAAAPSQSDGVVGALGGELRLVGDVVELVGVRAGSPGFASVEGGDRVHIGAAKLEVEQLEVGPHPIRRH
jgi:hypothetical protein